MPERSDGTPRQIKYNAASQTVLAYLRKNPNIVIPYREIQDELGYPPYTVANAVQRLATKEGIPVTRPAKGMVIYYSGEKAPELDLTEKTVIEPPIAAVPPTKEELNARAREMAVALHETGTVEYPPTTRVAPMYDYVGKMEAYSIIRDQSDDLFVAVPLMTFLNRE